MAADRRLFDSSAMTPPPAPEIDAVTCTVDEGFLPEQQSYPTLKGAIEAMNDIVEYAKAASIRHEVAGRRALFGLTGIMIALDTDLPEGWCRFTGRDGMEYGGPLSRIPKGVLGDKLTVAPDIWMAMLRLTQEAA